MPTLLMADRPRISPGRKVQARPGFTLAAALLGFFVVTLDATVVNVALPSIRGDFGGGISGLQWVVDGYTLMFAALLLSAGALSDRIGARRAFAAGVVLFAVASVACGLAPVLSVLIAARLVQGGAAAVMMPSSMALLGQAFPDPVPRARAVALWAMGGAAASSTGPVAGGLLTLASWRLIFFINIPAGAATLTPQQEGQRPRRYYQLTGEGIRSARRELALASTAQQPRLVPLGHPVAEGLG